MWLKHLQFGVTVVFTTLAFIMIIPALLLTYNFKVDKVVIDNIASVYKEFAEDIYTK